MCKAIRDMGVDTGHVTAAGQLFIHSVEHIGDISRLEFRFNEGARNLALSKTREIHRRKKKQVHWPLHCC